LFHPQEQVWTEHFAWSESGREINTARLRTDPPNPP
jgi:hypothetical protein